MYADWPDGCVQITQYSVVNRKRIGERWKGFSFKYGKEGSLKLKADESKMIVLGEEEGAM